LHVLTDTCTNRELYRWAATIFGSRGFSSDVLSDTLPAEQARLGGANGINARPQLRGLFRDHFSVLLPLLDILNHKPLAKVEWQPRTGFVGLQVLEDYGPGEEVFNNYGPRDNESLLLSYGFIIPGNPFDHVLLAITPPPGTLLDVARTWQMDPRSTMEHRCALLHMDHHSTSRATCFEQSVFTFDLLDTVSVLSTNDRESGAMFTANKTLLSTHLTSKNTFEDFRNFLSIFGQLLIRCEAGVARLSNTYPDHPPKTPKQQNAKAYRDVQARIYLTAKAVCQFILARACLSSDDEDADAHTLLALQPHLPNSTIIDLQSILSRHDPITIPGELLSPNGLISMLPQEYHSLLRTTLSSISKLTIATKACSTDLTPNQLQHTHLAVIVSVLGRLYESKAPLSKRLKVWLDYVTVWYPPTDPNWSYVPTTGPWPPGEEPPPALMALLAARDALLIKEQAPSTSSSSSSSNTSLSGSRNSSEATPNPHHEEQPPKQPAQQPWLDRSALCWGWNVMHEEKVLVPKEILAIADLDDATAVGAAAPDREGPMRPLLYLPTV
jgi:hypothetical protein